MAMLQPTRDQRLPVFATVIGKLQSRTRGRLTIMTLHVVAVRGHATWWIWAIQDTTGAHVEESTMQFASAAAAEAHGRARLVELEKHHNGVAR
jgi:hypothetical protein